jgi:uncharacterized protein (DUF58 family)
VEIANRGRRPAYDLQIGFLPVAGIWETEQTVSVVEALAPGETIKLHAEMRPLRRGRHALPQLRATTLFPLQLVRRSTVFPLPRRALILPFFHSLRSFDLIHSAPNVARGTTLSFHTLGMNGEYVGSREYQPGMPVRKWDYPSWARLGQPIVREFCDPRHPSTAIVLDTFFAAPQRSDKRPVPELEAILSLAASISEALMLLGHQVELLVIGHQMIFLQNHEPSASHRTVLEQLALADAGRAEQFPEVIRALGQLSLTWDSTFLLSHQWGQPQEELFAAVTRQTADGYRILVSDERRPDRGASFDLSRRLTCAQIETGEIDL